VSRQYRRRSALAPVSAAARACSAREGRVHSMSRPVRPHPMDADPCREVRLSLLPSSMLTN
jgi:hypothetical protein